MPGESNLHTLLHSMQPALQPGRYVYCTARELPVAVDQAIGIFKEAEGWTFILEQSVADALQLSYTFVAAWITLTVHSDLQAVGLTAAVAAALTELGISCNVVAAYYHDHIFVAHTDADAAMGALKALAAKAGAAPGA